jgi:hypothetical protein
MGLQYRKLVRNAVVAALSAGFQTTHAALANDYGVDPLTFDFTNGSSNFVQANIDPSEIELTPLLDLNPAGIALYTDKAVDTGRTRGISFDGGVLFTVCGIYMPRVGSETSDTESVMDAFEDAVLTTFNAYAWPVDQGLNYTRETSIERSKLMPLADGFRQWFELTGKFLVKIP